MPQVKVIQPITEQAKKLRVAAYARVSSDSADQLNSFATQVDYYTSYIRSKEEWEFAGLYADEAVSGTTADKRDDFQRLLADCRAGKIDRILVKSISRFARNTIDCIQTVRELGQLGVAVEFEKEETADCPSVNMSTGLIDFGNCRRVLDGERTIPMRHDVFYKDALIFDSLQSHKVKLYSKKTGKGVEMDLSGFDYLGVWSAANDGPFVALEPWTGCATCEDEDDILEHKRNMTKLQPGEKFSVAFTVTLF